MSIEPARNLRVVDVATGETTDFDDHVLHLEDQLAGAARDIAAWRMRYAELKRDKDAEARKHPLWPESVKVFRYWQEECKHPRSSFDRPRFELIAPLLKAHGFEMCKRAIDGAAYDPFITERKNGSKKRHDGIDLIFRSADKFEEFANRAPPPPQGELLPPES